MDESKVTGRQRTLEGLFGGWLFYLPLLVGVLFMLPRLSSPQFGLFDDGKTIITAREMSKDLSYFTFEADEGRFRPIYWLYFSALYWVFGEKPFWFFLGNTALLILSTGMLMAFTLAVTGKRSQAWMAGLFFVLSGPAVESYYTLSKGEPLQVTLLLLAMLSAVWSVKSRVAWKRGLFGLLGVAVTFGALAVKETALVMIPISLTWLCLAWLRQRKSPEQSAQSRWGKPMTVALAWFSVIGSGIFLLLRWLMINTVLTEGRYTNDYAIQSQAILASLVRWIGWSIRDFTFILPLILLVFIWLVAQKKSFDTGFMLESMVWMGGWAAIYLPWLFMTEYYMLPFAVGGAVFIAALFDIGWEALYSSKKRLRWLVAVCLGLAGLLFATTLLNNFSNARIQLSVDMVNDKMLADIAKSASPSSTVFVNIQDPNEYFFEIGMHISSVMDRPDLKVLPFKFQDFIVVKENTPGQILLVTPYVINQPLMIVRMGVVEATQVLWNDTLPVYMAEGNWREESSIESKFQLMMVNLPRLFCPLLKGRSFCNNSAPILDTRVFTYGWKIYSLDVP